jgi:hypothetical protein
MVNQPLITIEGFYIKLLYAIFEFFIEIVIFMKDIRIKPNSNSFFQLKNANLHSLELQLHFILIRDYLA